MRWIGFVPMRGGSKGIPNKNIRDFCGKPLCQRVISEMIQTPGWKRICIAVDSDEIECVVKSHLHHYIGSGVEIFRISREAGLDYNLWERGLLELIQEKNLGHKEILVMSQVTSPLTRSEHFKEAIEMYKKGRETLSCESLVSVATTHRFIWLGSGHPFNYHVKARERRQEFKGTLVENGAICINSVENIIADKSRLKVPCAIYEMPEHTYVEIDSEDDWNQAEYLFRHHVLGDR